MQLSDKQRGFVEKFIGLSRSADAAGDAPDDLSDPMEIWRNGKETADKSIDALQSALSDKDIPALSQIAKFGLNGLSERNQTDLMKALFEFSMANGAGRKTAAKALSDRVSTYQSFIEGDAVIALCENNPFGVSVDIKRPLVSALTRIRTLANAAAVAE